MPVRQVDYSFVGPEKICAAEYNELRQAVGWEEVPEDLVVKSLSHSILITARVGERLVGMARLISDMGMTALIADVMVHPDYQRRKIGDTLVRRLLAFQKKELGDGGFSYVNVLATKGNEGFYKPMGFLSRPNLLQGSGMTMKILANKINKFER